MLVEHEVKCDKKHRASDNSEIPSQLFVFNCLLALLYQEKVINIEVYAEKQHENADYHFGIQTAVALNALVEYGKSARTRCCKGVNYAVEYRHTARNKKNYLNERHYRINTVKYSCGKAEL